MIKSTISLDFLINHDWTQAFHEFLLSLLEHFFFSNSIWLFKSSMVSSTMLALCYLTVEFV